MDTYYVTITNILNYVFRLVAGPYRQKYNIANNSPCIIKRFLRGPVEIENTVTLNAMKYGKYGKSVCDHTRSETEVFQITS